MDTYNQFLVQFCRSTTCNWTITAADNSEKVYIEIIFIDVENDAACQYDYLRIRDGMYQIFMNPAHSIAPCAST